jgi:PIN domain nuclease of toxin-antitoxin system
MAAGRKVLTYLDTHVVLWMCKGEVPLSARASRLIQKADLRISPAVLLELRLLQEIGRLNVDPDHWLTMLTRDFEVTVCTLPLRRVVSQSFGLSWTRDPFDRLIVAQAIAGDGKLITRDRRVLANFPGAVW